MPNEVGRAVSAQDFRERDAFVDANVMRVNMLTAAEQNGVDLGLDALGESVRDWVRASYDTPATITYRIRQLTKADPTDYKFWEILWDIANFRADGDRRLRKVYLEDLLDRAQIQLAYAGADLIDEKDATREQFEHFLQQQVDEAEIELAASLISAEYLDEDTARDLFALGDQFGLTKQEFYDEIYPQLAKAVAEEGKGILPAGVVMILGELRDFYAE